MGIGEGRKRMAVSLEGHSDRSEGEPRSARKTSQRLLQSRAAHQPSLSSNLGA